MKELVNSKVSVKSKQQCLFLIFSYGLQLLLVILMSLMVFDHDISADISDSKAFSLLFIALVCPLLFIYVTYKFYCQLKIYFSFDKK